tara:strand:+ start:2015 stop:2218 length:204 start_codon:yes stop_codon:yes gene_type:complete
MNIYEIIIEVLKAARDKGASLDNDWEIEDIATEIYDMYYSSEMITSYISSGYMEDLKDYWEEKPLND